MDQKGLEVTAEAAAVLVGAARRRGSTRGGLSVQPLIKDAFDGAVFRAAEGERAFAGRFQPGVADLLAQPDESLRAAQIDGKRSLKDAIARRG